MYVQLLLIVLFGTITIVLNAPIETEIDNEISSGTVSDTKSDLVNSESLISQQKIPVNAILGKVNSVTDTKSTLLVQPSTGLNTARLETEGIPSKVLTVYDNSQKKVSDFLNPRPIVDTIEEHEKYGNSGDKFYTIGRAVVNGYEGFANLLNKLLDTPTTIAKQFSRQITAGLNVIGGKIVGL